VHSCVIAAGTSQQHPKMPQRTGFKVQNGP
jgi:hypothetical protein